MQPVLRKLWLQSTLYDWSTIDASQESQSIVTICSKGCGRQVENVSRSSHRSNQHCSELSSTILRRKAQVGRVSERRLSVAMIDQYMYRTISQKLLPVPIDVISPFKMNFSLLILLIKFELSLSTSNMPQIDRTAKIIILNIYCREWFDRRQISDTAPPFSLLPISHKANECIFVAVLVSTTFVIPMPLNPWSVSWHES